MRGQVVLLLTYLIASRVFELFWSRRNLHLLATLHPRVVPRDGLAGLVCVQVLWFLAIAAEDYFRGPTHVEPALLAACAAIFVASELVRYWCIQALGPRWSVRVVVLPGVDLVNHGPYRWMRHPNYAAVVIGIVMLPLALGLPYAALMNLPLVLYAMSVRIRAEERALRGSQDP